VLSHVLDLPEEGKQKVLAPFVGKTGRPPLPELAEIIPVLKMALPSVSAGLRTRLAKSFVQTRDIDDEAVFDRVKNSGGIVGLASEFDKSRKGTAGARRSKPPPTKPLATMDDAELATVAEPILTELTRRRLLHYHEYDADVFFRSAVLITSEDTDRNPQVEIQLSEDELENVAQKEQLNAAPVASTDASFDHYEPTALPNPVVNRSSVR
jgi:hypothetical protein